MLTIDYSLHDIEEIENAVTRWFYQDKKHYIVLPMMTLVTIWALSEPSLAKKYWEGAVNMHGKCWDNAEFNWVSRDSLKWELKRFWIEHSYSDVFQYD